MAKSKRRTSALKTERERVALLRHLVACIIQALEGHDVDDGAMALLFAGIVAEYKAIEDRYESSHK